MKLYRTQQERRDAGLCILCGNLPIDLEHTLYFCEPCRERRGALQKARIVRLREAGLCKRCNQPLGKKSILLCDVCLEKDRAYIRDIRRNRVENGLCLACGKYPPADPSRHDSYCEVCLARDRNGHKPDVARKWYDNLDPRWFLLKKARERARERNLPFNLDLEDIVIPNFCPALGIPLVRGKGKMHEGSPTLDQIIPGLGYTKGNVIVVSFRANAIKRTSSVEELGLIYKFYKKLVKKRNLL